MHQPHNPGRRGGGLALSAAGLLLVSFLIGWLALGGASVTWEAGILRALRQPDNPALGVGPSGTAVGFWLVSFLGSYAWLSAMAAAGCAFLAATGRRRLALAVLCAVASAILAALALKVLAGRPRPEVVPHLGGFTGASFPSSHAMLSIAVYGTLAVALAASRTSRWLACLAAIALAAVIGFSRLYLGVHWPTDVLAGWCLGGAWLLGFTWFCGPSGAGRARTPPRRDHAPPQQPG
ncbi:hypothetical protein GCM10019059_24470 [Camelimonas fluminis]|uniref:Phosphatase PAP2 family protein n=1 Tax=Camelimonas fluminis TaxID=1576911 RepID=A0ABV7UBH8_9HYPH|nr:phosphatase PAP2 family protein [Camelimonas fluminis]GHE64010.1 hypothetical protein GCM10019059_24470 [Camelimonas fluminis]